LICIGDKNTNLTERFVLQGVSGGPLKSLHYLWQFHMHWGSSDSEGSEHLISGNAFAGEVILFLEIC
jgi:hypothetical protein